MTENKFSPDYVKSLEFQLNQKTRGRFSPLAAKEFIDILEQWLPPAAESSPMDPEDINYCAGYNTYKAQILENLRWVK